MSLNGVRMGALPGARRQGESSKECVMAQSLRDSVHLVSDPRNLDASVEEVFDLMLGVPCERSHVQAVKSNESVTAVVGFGGLLSGACVFRTSGESARLIASKLTGTDFDEIDDTVKDAIGEICNMLAGAWKGKVPDLSANCGLSVPAVITGRDYNIHIQSPEFRLFHCYTFDSTPFDVTIICDGLY
jgi:chemotaxis protein CheX